MEGVNDANPGGMINTPTWGSRLYHGYVNDQYNGNGSRVYPWLEVLPAHPSVSPWTATAANTQVEARNLEVWHKVGSVWTLELSLYTSSGWDAPHFYDKASYSPAPRQVTPTNITGGVAQAANEMGPSGNARWIWHFYAEMVGSSGAKSEVYVIRCQMRLGLINPAGVDDRANVRLYGHAAADWYNSGGIVGPVMQGRFKLLRPSWQDFCAVNIHVSRQASGGPYFPGALSAAELRANPPPFAT
jgi:hypothetical protein